MAKDDDPKSDALELRRRAEERLKERPKSRKPEAGAPGATEEAQRLIQELQVHQIELEMQNEELRKSRVEVETLLLQYTDLYDFAPVGYLTLDRAGTIRRVNLNGAHLLGKDRHRLRNSRIESFISEADRSAFNHFLKTVFAEQTSASGRASCEVAIGEQQERTPWFQSSGSRQADGATRRHVHIEATATADLQECRAVLMDITERKQAEAALQEIHAKLERNLKGTIDVLSETIGKKGPYPPGHHRRVAALASAIAREMGLPDFQVQGIGLAAAVYDIGLMNVPPELLQNPNRLEGLKLTLYQGYPQAGHDALKRIEFPWPIADIVLQHRECFDGSGFPQGLKGKDILIEARVLAVSGALDNLTLHRSYRNALPLDEALAAITKHSGSRFDPEVVTACLRLFNEKGFRMEN